MPTSILLRLLKFVLPACLLVGAALAIYGTWAHSPPVPLAQLFPGQVAVLVGTGNGQSSYVLVPDAALDPRIVTVWRDASGRPQLAQSREGFFLLALFYLVCLTGSGWLWLGAPGRGDRYKPKRARGAEVGSR